MKRMAASGAKRSFVATADKNIAKPYRFAIKAGIGSKRPTAGVVDQPPVRTISGVSLRGRREQPVASDFARLILSARAASLFGNDHQAIEFARGHFPAFAMW
jgi:hypothetical protein